jgi:hypothetical protein
MPYTASVASTAFDRGQLVVTIAYSDGHQTVQETMTTRGPQDTNWIQKEVARRIAELDGLETFSASIKEGPVTVSTVKLAAVASSPRDAYAAKLAEFRRWLAALREGIVPTDRASFVALRTWLKDNFIDEYIDLFEG